MKRFTIWEQRVTIGDIVVTSNWIEKEWNMLDDKDLEVLEGNRSKFVYYAMGCYGLTEQDAEDVFQDALLHVWRYDRDGYALRYFFYNFRHELHRYGITRRAKSRGGGVEPVSLDSEVHNGKGDGSNSEWLELITVIPEAHRELSKPYRPVELQVVVREFVGSLGWRGKYLVSGKKGQLGWIDNQLRDYDNNIVRRKRVRRNNMKQQEEVSHV